MPTITAAGRLRSFAIFSQRYFCHAEIAPIRRFSLLSLIRLLLPLARYYDISLRYRHSLHDTLMILLFIIAMIRDDIMIDAVDDSGGEHIDAFMFTPLLMLLLRRCCRLSIDADFRYFRQALRLIILLLI